MSLSGELKVDPIFAEAIEKLPDGFAVYDANDQVIMINSIALRRFGTFYKALMGGKSYLDALRITIKRSWPDGAPEAREAMAQKMLACYHSGETYEAWTEDGRIVRATCQSMNDGRKVAISVDITDLRERERELKRLERAAVAASQAKSAFLANVSHEIRTPLNGIMGMAQVLELDTLKPHQREQVATILDSGRNLMAILNDILDLSKIEAGKIDIAPADADLQQTMQGLYRLWQPKAAEASLSFSMSVDADLPQMLSFDVVRVRQCVSNLISNAIKFTDKGRVDVAVAGQPQPDGRCLVSVSVRDTGPGMDAETQGRLFQAFEQADASTSRRFGGTGLGLSIVRSLAQLMGGSASVTSELGRGSEFTFSFMAAQAVGAALASKTAVDDLDGAMAKIQGLKVLLVDDHPVNRKVAGLVLRPFNMQITEAEHGQEALEALAREPFDLVLLDMHMPVMDGPATIAAIRGSQSAFRDVMVVALTADAMSGDRERYLRMGMNGYLSKPLIVTDVIAEIARVKSRPKSLKPRAA